MILWEALKLSVSYLELETLEGKLKLANLSWDLFI